MDILNIENIKGLTDEEIRLVIFLALNQRRISEKGALIPIDSLNELSEEEKIEQIFKCIKGKNERT